MRSLVRTFAVLIAVSCCLTAAFAAERVAGTVRDALGEPVAGATVTVVADGRIATTVTGSDGAFAFEGVSSDAVQLRVEASGFRAASAMWTAGAPLVVTLAPAPLSDEVTVTAERTATRVGDTAASVVVLSRRDLDETAAVTLDAALKQVPGFQLFRRTDSRAANPTAQGASLRGVAPSGASRAVVLADGVPLNDPFGGWVYWGRVPEAAIERVEVARGGASSLYGTDALGGAIQILTTASRSEPWLRLDASAGNQVTGEASAAGGFALGPWRVRLAAEAFHTDGYVLVADGERGPVDTPAASEHRTLSATVERRFARGRAFVRGSIFHESRENGTPLQTNGTYIRELVVGGDVSGDALGALAFRLYSSAELYDQTFSAIAADRASEALTRVQRVPSQQFGAWAQWVRAFAERHTLVAGAEGREVRGASDELGLFGGRFTSASGAGGRQRSFGLFGDAILAPGEDWTVTVGGRVDRWRNVDALATVRPLPDTGTAAVTPFSDRSETAFSPRVSFVYRVAPGVSLRGAAYRAFRAPTLNELYRGFRVGGVVTLANADLRAERLTGGEIGAGVDALDGRLGVRATAFWSDVTRPVANVTLSATSDLITRIRRNLGRTRSRGVEVDAEARIGSRVVLTGGYTFVDATVVRFEASPALEGLRIPQVPRHVATGQLRYSAPWRVTVSALARASSSQFDDDRNQLRLDAYGTLDLVLSRPLGRGVEVYLAVENVFDRRYEVGKTPVTTVGPPVFVRAGIRWIVP